MYRLYNSIILAVISHTSLTLTFSFMWVKSQTCRYVTWTNGHCTNTRRSTESRQSTLAECCEKGNELSRYIQGLICLSKKLLLHCIYTFKRADKFAKRNINFFISVCPHEASRLRLDNTWWIRSVVTKSPVLITKMSGSYNLHIFVLRSLFVRNKIRSLNR